VCISGDILKSVRYEKRESGPISPLSTLRGGRREGRCVSLTSTEGRKVMSVFAFNLVQRGEKKSLRLSTFIPSYAGTKRRKKIIFCSRKGGCVLFI